MARTPVGPLGGASARGALLLAVAIVGRPAAAQYLPAFVPPAVPWAPRDPRIPWQDSVRQSDETLWMLGALLGAGVLGVIGIGFGSWGCSADESCLDDRVKGFLIGAAVGFPLGGIIGDAIHVTPAPDSTTAAPSSAGPGTLMARRAPDIGPLQQSLTRIADSTARRPTYWLEGGLAGTAVMGLLGAAVGAGFCAGSETPEPAGKCLAAGVLGFAFAGIGVGLPAGALIGGAFPKGAPSNQEEAGNAERADQPHRQAGPVLRLLEPARRR